MNEYNRIESSFLIQAPSKHEIDFAFRSMRMPYNPDRWFSAAENEELATRLTKAGPSHRKFLRMIPLRAEIVAPIYFWAQLDTYKVATVRSSESAMVALRNGFDASKWSFSIETPCESIERFLGAVRRFYADRKSEIAFRQCRASMPCGTMLRSCWYASMETALIIKEQRDCHKLKEWEQFISAIEEALLVVGVSLGA